MELPNDLIVVVMTYTTPELTLNVGTLGFGLAGTTLYRNQFWRRKLIFEREGVIIDNEKLIRDPDVIEPQLDWYIHYRLLNIRSDPGTCYLDIADRNPMLIARDAVVLSGPNAGSPIGLSVLTADHKWYDVETFAGEWSIFEAYQAIPAKDINGVGYGISRDGRNIIDRLGEIIASLPDQQIATEIQHNLFPIIVARSQALFKLQPTGRLVMVAEVGKDKALWTIRGRPGEVGVVFSGGWDSPRVVQTIDHGLAITANGLAIRIIGSDRIRLPGRFMRGAYRQEEYHLLRPDGVVEVYNEDCDLVRVSDLPPISDLVQVGARFAYTVRN